MEVWVLRRPPVNFFPPPILLRLVRKNFFTSSYFWTGLSLKIYSGYSGCIQYVHYSGVWFLVHQIVSRRQSREGLSMLSKFYSTEFPSKIYDHVISNSSNLQFWSSFRCSFWSRGFQPVRIHSFGSSVPKERISKSLNVDQKCTKITTVWSRDFLFDGSKPIPWFHGTENPKSGSKFNS